MIVKRKPLSDLNPSAYNPRKALGPEDRDFDRLASSVRTFGNVEPIVWNEATGNIVGGHQRYSVLKHLGETETDVVVVNLDDEDEHLLNIALNKIQGKWDYDRLSETLSRFGPADASLTGFSPQEIMLLVAEANDKVTEAIGKATSMDPVVPQEPFAPFDGPAREEGDPEAPGSADFGGMDGAAVPVDGSDGVSWAVRLKFRSFDSANAWLEANGIPKRLKKGWTTIVVRMGEDDDCE